MIKAEEIRLGNQIRYSHVNVNPVWEGKMVVVDKEIINDIIIDGREESFDGIPLSPEILEKCGFICQAAQWKKVYNSEGNIFTVNQIDGEYFLNVYEMQFRYLHELQNTYRFTTGSELSIAEL